MSRNNSNNNNIWRPLFCFAIIAGASTIVALLPPPAVSLTHNHHHRHPLRIRTGSNRIIGGASIDSCRMNLILSQKRRRSMLFDTNANLEGESRQDENESQNDGDSDDKKQNDEKENSNNTDTNINDTKNNNIQQQPTTLTEKEQQPGIGGKGGITYDVNKLKRNLVQEAVRQYKKELIEQLLTAPTAATNNDSSNSSTSNSSPNTRRGGLLVGRSKEQQTRQQIIEEKIAALIEANPVSTTTDSNLLQGLWEFTFLADNASTILGAGSSVGGSAVSGRVPKGRSLDIDTALGRGVEYRENLEAEERFWNSGPWRANTKGTGDGDNGGIRENPFRTATRFFNLEDLEYEEDPYILDTMAYMNGLWSIERQYDVVGLTRTTLELKLNKLSINICGKLIRRKEGVKAGIGLGTFDIKFFYLDNDLCIASMLSRERDNLLVYTKSKDRGASTERNKKQLRFLLASLSWLVRLESPLKLRRTLSKLTGLNIVTDIIFRKNKSKVGEEEQSTIITKDSKIMYRRQDTATDETVLRVLRLGALTDDTAQDEKVAWGGEEDPFVDLPAVERQEVMKKMSLEEIEKAGEKQRKIIQEKRRKGYNKQKKFKRPS